MRQFNSYGPVDAHHHYYVPRRDLIEQLVDQLVGISEEGGHYFTLWAARQTGKTWLMRQAKAEVRQRYGDQFTIYHFSLEKMRNMNYGPQELDQKKLPSVLSDILRTKLPNHPELKSWEDLTQIFAKEGGLWDRPLLLLIDEVDVLAPELLDLLVTQFRDLYLARESHWLHGLAFIGIRAVLGVESQRWSPFNVQRSLRVPNLTQAEVEAMYQQYQQESGQVIAPEVVSQVYEATRGQPGLVSWFGELLTTKYNPGSEQVITNETWSLVWDSARYIEPNNTVTNQIAKAQDETYQGFLTQLFTKAELPFSFHNPIHNYLYMHGILDYEATSEKDRRRRYICRFSSPFIQDCLYDALSDALISETLPLLALDPRDTLTDVFETCDDRNLNLAALLERYKQYLQGLKTEGLNPWKDQPRRKTDHQLAEAVGHFHLYAWLQEAIFGLGSVSPEFPTGNGKVDLHIKADARQGIIEVKSFSNAARLKKDRETAAQYAKDLGLDRVTMAVFIPVTDEAVLAELSSDEQINGVQVTVVMMALATRPKLLIADELGTALDVTIFESKFKAGARKRICGGFGQL